MKKKYVQPMAAVSDYCTATMLALSGNFIEGETTEETINPDVPIDGNEAWTKGFIWDENIFE